jgi:hypothetical protein
MRSGGNAILMAKSDNRPVAAYPKEENEFSFVSFASFVVSLDLLILLSAIHQTNMRCGGFLRDRQTSRSRSRVGGRVEAV